MNTVSLCMIVKNEEKNLKKCLESVAPYVDEIIIADTGSTDGTKEICENFSVQLYQYTWEDNFSEARNFSISKATGDWILWMDADEVLENKSQKKLSFLLEDHNEVYSVKLLHYCDTKESSLFDDYISYNYRIFKNHKNFYFDGRIHEKLVKDTTDDTATPFNKVPILEPLTIHHTGYLPEYKEEKTARNLSLLMKEKELSPANPLTYYHLAAEFYRMNDPDEALKNLDLSIAYFLQAGQKPSSLVYKLKYYIVCTLCRENSYLGIEKAIELYPDYVDLHFYRGILLYRQGHFEDAIKAFSYCVILGENNSNYLISLGTGTYQAFYYLGKCYEKLNNKELAKIAYHQATLYKADYIKVQDKLKSLL